jgi:hypothetical protein
MHTATQSLPAELLDVTFVDWDGSRKAELEKVPRTSTVGQVMNEAVSHLGLPLQHLYQASLRGVEVDSGQTLDDLGIETDVQFDLVPVVSAGYVERDLPARGASGVEGTVSAQTTTRSSSLGSA